MILSVSASHAIRALAVLSETPGEYLLARDIADRAGIPTPYCAKVLQPFVRVGVLRSARGRSGGFALAVKPAELRLGVIRKRIDPPLPCGFGATRCDAASVGCPMQALGLCQARHEVVERFDAVTLAQFAAATRADAGRRAGAA